MAMAMLRPHQLVGRNLGRFVIWVLGVAAFTAVERVVNSFLDDQEKRGHDIGWLGHMIVSTAPVWIIAGAATVGLLYVFWPWLATLFHKTPPAEAQPTQPAVAPAPAAGIAVRGGSDIRLERNVVTGYGTGIDVDNSQRLIAAGNVVTAEKNEERKWLTVDPKELTKLYKDNTSVQADKKVEPHKGRWMHVSGKIDSVRQVHELYGGGREVMFRVDWTDTNPVAYLMYFDEKWADGLDTKHPGDLIHVCGKIDSVATTLIVLRQCELEHLTSPRGPIASPHPSPASQTLPSASMGQQPELRDGEQIDDTQPTNPKPTLAPEEGAWLPVDPDEPVRLCSGLTTLQGRAMIAKYVGNWMRVTGMVREIEPYVDRKVWITLQNIPGKRYHYTLIFDDTEYDALFSKTIGDEIKAVGRIENITEHGYFLKCCRLERR